MLRPRTSFPLSSGSRRHQLARVFVCSGSTSPGDGQKSIDAVVVGDHPRPTMNCMRSAVPVAAQKDFACSIVDGRLQKAHVT